THRYLVAGSGAGDAGTVAVFNATTGQAVATFPPFGPSFTGGVHVAVADINNDGFPDMICAAGAGGGPDVKVISGKDSSVLLGFFAFGAGFTGGVVVAAGDVNGDGFADLICGA